jgi:aspartyl-tRNA(Asn)/glutamyl-tRNA(Gln) amidotransferase subunit B
MKLKNILCVGILCLNFLELHAAAGESTAQLYARSVATVTVKKTRKRRLTSGESTAQFYARSSTTIQEKEHFLETYLTDLLLPPSVINIIKLMLVSKFSRIQSIPYRPSDELSLCYVGLPSETQCTVHELFKGTTYFDIIPGNMTTLDTSTELDNSPRINLCTLLSGRDVPHLAFQTTSFYYKFFGYVKPDIEVPVQIISSTRPTENLLDPQEDYRWKVTEGHISPISFSDSEKLAAFYRNGHVHVHRLTYDIEQKDPLSMANPSHDRYEPVIGVEVHIQLTTATKIFCRCPNIPLAEPNSNICEVCTGQPGALPTLNAAVVDSALKVGLATQCRINTQSIFARKHYFYPDLPKNFQITQADYPIAEYGTLAVPLEDGSSLTVRIRRIHLEEDAGKSIHASDGTCSFVDLNRAGTPLLEIVSEPDMHSPGHVRSYLKELHAIVTTLGVCSGNMEEGAFRADTNVSVRLRGATKLGTRCELKNINSFKFISDAVTYEINRQIELLEQGESIVQQTRLWDTRQHITVPMRSKEEAADYRYMPEPDLPPVIVTSEAIDSIKTQLPELPAQRFERLKTTYSLTPAEATLLAYDRDLARYYEQAARYTTSPKLINWIVRDLMSYLKEHNQPIAHHLKATAPLRPEQLAQLVQLIEEGTINARSAQEIFSEIAITGKSPQTIIQERGMQKIGSIEELTALAQAVIRENPRQVEQYQSGNTKLWGFFVGKVMEKTQGRADPTVVNTILRKLI